MAVRSRLLLPDITVRVASGEMDVVSRQALLEAMADAAVLQDMAGGVISVAVQRVPTGAPNEMVTVSAMVEWRDRTDAKAQPEAHAEPTERVYAVRPGEEWIPSDPRTEEDIIHGVEEPEEPEHPVLPFEHVEAASPDGLDESKLEEEDIADLSEATR